MKGFVVVVVSDEVEKKGRRSGWYEEQAVVSRTCLSFETHCNKSQNDAEATEIKNKTYVACFLCKAIILSTIFVGAGSAEGEDESLSFCFLGSLVEESSGMVEG